MHSRGQSEIVGAALLALIVAVLGSILLYQVLRVSSLIKFTLGGGKCDFTIVSVPYNITTSSIVLRPVVYNVGQAPCKIVEVFILTENTTLVLNRTKLSIIVEPSSLYILPQITIPRSGLSEKTLIVRVVSEDGVVQDFTLHLE